MFGCTTNGDDLSGHLHLPDVGPLSNFGSFSNEFDDTVLMKQEFCHTTSNTSSGCSSYASPTSYQIPCFMQRSVSSHALYKNGTNFQHQQYPELFDSDSSTVRKVFSTGDLHRMNMVQQMNERSESPVLSNESSSIIEGVNAKATRYTPEEKKERIERYRSKRNQRNFNKKIKYVCRKTLADSRPRIRGRFAKNDEVIDQKAPENECNNFQMIAHPHQHHTTEYYDDNWDGFLDEIAANLIS